MRTKKFFLAFIVVFIILEITNFLIHGVILSSTYMSEGLRQVFRPEEEMMGMMWIMWVCDLIWSFFFVFIFVRGYENKGLMEGVRFGFYIGIFMSATYAIGSYAVYPLPFSLVFEWLIYGIIQSIILGITAALIYKPGKASVPQSAIAA